MNKKTIIRTLVITGVLLAMLSTIALCSDKGKGGQMQLSLPTINESGE